MTCESEPVSPVSRGEVAASTDLVDELRVLRVVDMRGERDVVDRSARERGELLAQRRDEEVNAQSPRNLGASVQRSNLRRLVHDGLPDENVSEPG